MTVIMFTIWTVESEDVCWSAALNNEQNKTKNNPAALWLSPQIVPSEKKIKTPKSLLVILVNVSQHASPKPARGGKTSTVVRQRVTGSPAVLPALIADDQLCRGYRPFKNSSLPGGDAHVSSRLIRFALQHCFSKSETKCFLIRIK